MALELQARSLNLAIHSVPQGTFLSETLATAYLPSLTRLTESFHVEPWRVPAVAFLAVKENRLPRQGFKANFSRRVTQSVPRGTPVPTARVFHRLVFHVEHNDPSGHQNETSVNLSKRTFQIESIAPCLRNCLFSRHQKWTPKVPRETFLIAKPRFISREMTQKSRNEVTSHTPTVVTPTFRCSLSPLEDIFAATEAPKSAPANSNAAICALHPNHVRRSTVKFGAPTIGPTPPIPGRARTHPPPVNTHNLGVPTLRRAPHSG
jgi:hypothetical protein